MWWDNDFFDEFRRMQEDIDRIMGRVGRRFEMPLLGVATDTQAVVPREHFRVPFTELKETEKSMVVSFDMPGVDKKDIQLNVNDDSIEVKVEKKQEKEEKSKDTHFYSYVSRSFYRCVPLPKRVDASKAVAEYKDGVLRVEAPKLSQEKTKRITVK
ncbi:MAG: Hsp20/alpha crystallin family protein [Candidatus Woesearchaeota archaeon]